MDDLKAHDGLLELALFAGAGGGILGGHLLGWRTVCAVERDLYAASVLASRQNDGCLPPFPVWADVSAFRSDNPDCAEMFDALRSIRGRLVISGGFPCQDISCAGRGAGLEGERSGLWGEFARIIREIRPRYAFVENSPMLASRGLGTVLGDLAEAGYDARWCVLGADDIGAPHRRKRIWIRAELADASSQRSAAGVPGQEQREARDTREPFDGGRISWWDEDPADVGDAEGVSDDGGRCELREAESRREGIDAEAGDAGPAAADVADAACELPPKSGRARTGRAESSDRSCPQAGRERSDGRPTEPRVGRVAHGLAHRVDKLRAIGNGQVPAVAATAWRILTPNQKEAE